MRSLIYWPEAADEPAVASIRAEADPEDPDLTPEGEEGDEDQSEDDSDAATFAPGEISDDEF